MKGRPVRVPGKKFVLIYFDGTNKYLNCEAKKVIHDEENLSLEDLIGSYVTVEDMEGKHTGVLKAFGSQSDMNEKETELEAEALNRSMEDHEQGDDDGLSQPTVTHAVVLWKADQKYSRISLRKINWDHEYGDPLEIVGKTFKARWKGNELNAIVKAVGSKDEMDQQLQFWKKQDTNSGGSDKDKENQHSKQVVLGNKSKPRAEAQPELATQNKRKHTDVDNEGEDLGEVAVIEKQSKADSAKSQRISELESEVRTLKLKFQKERSRKKLLQQRVHDGGIGSGRLVQVGCGLSITESQLNHLSSYKKQASQYFSHLNRFTGAFALQTLADSSVTGVKTLTSPIEGPRPPLDAEKLNALKAFTIQRCGIIDNDDKVKDFKRKLSSLCTNARRAVDRRNKKIEESNVIPQSYELEQSRDIEPFEFDDL